MENKYNMDKMIRSLAQSFTSTTGINFDELYSEANLAYCEAVFSYDPNKGAKLTTHVFNIVKNALINFCKQELKHKVSDVEFDITFETKPWQDMEAAFTGLSKKVIDIVFENDNFQGSSRAMRQQVVCYLRNEGWTWEKVWDGMRETKLVVANN